MTLPQLALAATGNTYLIRDAGSFVAGQTRDKTDDVGGADIKAWLSDLDWTEVTSGVRADGMGYAGCRYFVATLPDDAEAYEAIAEWGSLTPEQRARVVVRRSPHASAKTGHTNELISSEVAPTRTHQVALAVGNKHNPSDEPEAAPVVYFWAPGRFTKFTIIDEQMAEDRGLIPSHATVKLEGPLPAGA